MENQTSNFRCVLGSTAALNLIYSPAEAALLLIALELPRAEGVVMDWNGTKLSWRGGSCCCGILPACLT